MSKRTQAASVTRTESPWRPRAGIRLSESRNGKLLRKAAGGTGMVGRTFSQYRVLERVGKGGMSVVYKARDLKLDRLVALKFLPPHLLASDDALSRFLREARAISALNHPNIATIYDLGRRQGEIFLVLEYLPGGTLRSLVRDISSSGGRLAPKQLLEFALGITEGLSHAHRQGIIHRDVKTDNVMLTAEGTVKITDFGLAKLRGGTHLTQAGTIVGTVSYMSPEQARGEPVDHRSDIFSLGIVLYEMATGQLPFRGRHEAAILSAILNDCPPDVSESRADLPPDFGQIVSKALEKDPKRRYQHVDELLVDLHLAGWGRDSRAANIACDDETRTISRPASGRKQSRWRAFLSARTWLRVITEFF